MHLIAPLMAGVAGAESGTATLYIRGTTNVATYYTEFEGTSAFPGTSIALDARGGATVYVNELVRVIIRSSAGVTIRDYVDGCSAPAVEVRSTSFLGAAYSGGAIAAGNPTTLQSVLDAWYTSAGAVDFNVLAGGASKTLQAAFGSLSGLRLYLVTDPSYGAVGDGVTDDTAALNAAIAAANAAGGGVVFLPQGSYLVSATLTTYADVSLEGAGSDVTTVRVSSSSLSLVSGLCPFRVSGISIVFANSPYTGTLFNATSSSEALGFRPVFEDVVAAKSGSCSGTIFSSSALNVVAFRGCRFSVITSGACVVGGALTSLTVNECELICTGAGAYTGDLVRSAGGAMISGTILSMSGVPSTGGTYIDNDGRAVVNGCLFFAPASGTCTVFDANNASAVMTESGNDVSHVLASSVTFTMYAFAAASLAVSKVSSRDNAFLQHPTPDTATLTIDSASYGVVKVNATAGGARTYTFTAAPYGARFILSFTNGSGVAIAISFSSAVFVGAADDDVTAGATKTYSFVALNGGGFTYWACTSVNLPKEIAP